MTSPLAPSVEMRSPLILTQTYSDYLRTARLHAPSPQRTRPEVKGNLHGRGRRGGQRKSLLHRQPPRGGQPPLPTPSSAARSHFSETTHSSRARQQATQIRPTPASRTEHHKSRRRGWGMSGGEGRRTERERGGGEGQQVDRGGEVEEGEGEEGEGEEGEGEGRAAPDNVVPSPHPPPSSQPTPPPPSSQPTPPPPSSQPSPPPPSSQPTPPPPSSQPTPPPPSSQPTPPPPSSQPTPPPPSSQPSPHTTQQQQDSLLSLPHLVGMTTTLQQMEVRSIFGGHYLVVSVYSIYYCTLYSVVHYTIITTQHCTIIILHIQWGSGYHYIILPRDHN